MTPLLDTRSPFAILRRHWLVFAVAFLATLAPIVAWTLTRTPLYEATGKVMIQLGREYSSQPSVGDRQAVLNRDPQAAINTELHILLSQDLLDSVVDRMGAEALYPRQANKSEIRDLIAAVVSRMGAEPRNPRPAESERGGGEIGVEKVSEEEKKLAASRKLAGAFTARLLPESSVIQLALRHPSPEIAERALDVLFEEFKDEHLNAFGNPQVPAFLEEKVAQYRTRLEESEDRLKEFLVGNEALYLEAEQGDAAVNERARLAAELDLNASRVAGLRQQIRFLEDEQVRSPTKTESDARAQQNQMIEGARLKLLDLQVEQERLLGTYSETSRPVTAIREQIKIVEDFLARQEAAVGGGRLIEALASEVARLNAELQFELARGGELSRQLAQIDTEMTSMPERTRQYRDLTRERDLNERYLDAYLNELEEARLAADLDQARIANIVLIQQVRVGPEPVSPNRRLNFAVGGLLALIVGSAVALGAEMRASGRAAVRAPAGADRATAQVADGDQRRGVATGFGGRIEGPQPQGPRQP